jgi:hypothetical protein
MKKIVKYSHWRIPEMMFLALSLVYLYPWVTLFSALSCSMARTREMLKTKLDTGKENRSPIRSQIEQIIRNIYQLSSRETVPDEESGCGILIMTPRDKVCAPVLLCPNLPENRCKFSGADNKEEFSKEILHLRILWFFFV